MKLPLLLQQMQNSTSNFKPPISPFWILIHFLCCLVSTVLGFRFSRLLFFLFFSTSPLFNSLSTTITTTTTTTITTITTTTETLSLSVHSNSTSSPVLPFSSNETTSHPVVGRHGIRVRPWPYPDPKEVLRAHNIIKQVQMEQRKFFSIKNPRPIIAITPTFARATQAMHLTSLAHTLRLVPYEVTWIVVEAGRTSNGTGSLLEKSRVPYVHLGFDESMPEDLIERRNFEAKMRMHALRIIKEQKMEGIILFTDESNIHDLKLFDEAQKVKSIGAVQLSFLSPPNQQNDDFAPKAQGPICDSSGKITGFKTWEFENDGFAPKGRTEWAGFAIDANFIFEKDLDVINEDIMGLVGNGSGMDPLHDCQESVLVWWIRAETRPDSIFPQNWIIENGDLSTNTRR
ncbi:hypothetical protein LUZ60_003003 [Juncus effusus]|nr:hypothetical protein LUZ60_003003 [Juncus effusus]